MDKLTRNEIQVSYEALPVKDKYYIDIHVTDLQHHLRQRYRRDRGEITQADALELLAKIGALMVEKGL